MSDLIDRIPGNESALARIREVSEQSLQLKARQRASGRSGQLGYTIDSGKEWDSEVTLPYTNETYRVAEFTLSVTGDKSQRFPIVIPKLDVRVNGVADGNKMKFVAGNHGYVYDDSNVSVTAVDYASPDDSGFGDEFKNSWKLRLMYIGVRGVGNASLKLKLRAQSSSPGAVSVVRVL